MLVGSAYGKVGLDSSGVVTGVQQAVNALKNFKSTMELAGGGLNKLKSGLDSAKSAVAAARAELDKLKAGKAGKEEIEAAAASLKKLEANANTAATAVRNAETQIQQLRQAGMALGQGMQNVGNMLTVGVTLPLLAAGGAAIKLASDLNESKSLTGVIFSDMSKDILKWAEDANTKLQMTRKEALDSANDFAIFGKAAKLAGNDLVKFAEENTQLAADLASAKNTSSDEAITAIGAAYRGEMEPIRKYGVLLDQQIVKDKAVSMGLMKTNDELTTQNKILAVNALVLEQTSYAQGDIARTGGEVAGQMKEANKSIQDLLADFGTNLLPMARNALVVFNQLLRFLNNLSPSTQQNIIVFLGLAAALGPVLSTMGGLLMFVLQITAIWPQVVTGAALIAPTFATIGTVITGTVIPAIVGFIGAALPIIAVVALVAAAIGLLYWAFSTNFMGITDTVKMLGVIIPFYINQMWNSVVLYFANAWKTLTDISRKIATSIADAFKIDWGQIGANIISGIVNGIINGIGALIEAAKRAANAVMDAFKQTLQIASPSKKFDWFGKMSGVGYINGLNSAVQPAMVASAASRPVQQMARATSYQTLNFADGLSIHEARRMQVESERRMQVWTRKLLGA